MGLRGAGVQPTAVSVGLCSSCSSSMDGCMCHKGCWGAVSGLLCPRHNVVEDFKVSIIRNQRAAPKTRPVPGFPAQISLSTAPSHPLFFELLFGAISTPFPSLVLEVLSSQLGLIVPLEAEQWSAMGH